MRDQESMADSFATQTDFLVEERRWRDRLLILEADNPEHLPRFPISIPVDNDANIEEMARLQRDADFMMWVLSNTTYPPFSSHFLPSKLLILIPVSGKK